jgi:glycine dehydrogenase subunit 1
MRYLPHTEEDISEMLKVVGVGSLEDLYRTIPAECLRKSELNLPAPMTEWELDEHMASLAGRMAAATNHKLFLGAGSYEHYVPESVKQLLTRSEFVTAYTPYQPEMSQGTLQAIYEYQTLVSRLLGMETANASMYDGASALAEALLMAIRITRRNNIAISRAIHPSYRQVVKTYLAAGGHEIIEMPFLENGKTDLTAMTGIADLAAVAVQSPNFFGCIEDLKPIGEITHQKEALFVVSFSEPLAYGLLKSPGSQGADIACGEGQSLGIPQSFGGPGLGIFAAKMDFVRSMPGRLVGMSKDLDGKRAFVLTLATREQHIRREKATSNICTNNSLCALATVMYMASLGGTGMGELAELNHDKSEYLKSELIKAGFKIPFSAPTFNEFVVEFPPGFDSTYKRLLEKKIVPGLPLGPHYPELPNHYLICATETKTKADVDLLMQEIKS